MNNAFFWNSGISLEGSAQSYIMMQCNRHEASDKSPNYFICWNDAIFIKQTIHTVGWQSKCGKTLTDLTPLNQSCPLQKPSIWLFIKQNY